MATRGMAEPGGGARSSNNNSLQNIHASQHPNQSATSLNQAKAVLSQVLTNMDPMQN